MAFRGKKMLKSKYFKKSKLLRIKFYPTKHLKKLKFGQLGLYLKKGPPEALGNHK